MKFMVFDEKVRFMLVCVCVCECGRDRHSFSGSNSGTKVTQGVCVCGCARGGSGLVKLHLAFGQVCLFTAVQFCVPDVTLLLPF